MMRKSARGAVALLIGIATAPALAAAPAKNVVLVVADDLGSGDLGCYGHPLVKTPNIDALAREGTRFRSAFCTTASCSASRSVILSGQYNHANGQYGHAHAEHHFSSLPGVKSLPVRLADAGYRTARIGKFHVAPEEVYRFQTSLGEDARNPVRMAESCRDFIAADPSRPFFLYYCTADPHRSGGQAGPPPESPNLFGNRPDGGSYPGVEEVRYNPAEVPVPPFLPDTPAARAELAQYLQSVSRVDQGVGRLVQVLKEAGAWESTLILFISDNGIAMPGAKTTAYEPGVRLPCVVRHPGLGEPGVTSEAMITWADLAPTILDWAGALAPEGDKSLHGRSFLGVLGRADAPGWDEVFLSHTFHEITMYYPMRTLRDRRYKLIWNIAAPMEFPFASDLWSAATWQAALAGGPDAPYGRRTVALTQRRPKWELFDLEADPHETKNLADDPAHRDRLREMQARLKAHQGRTQDPWVVKWTHE